MRFAIYALLIALNLSGSSKKTNESKTKKEDGHTKIESPADRRRRALAQQDNLSEEDLTEQAEILYNYLLEQNKAQLKSLPSMMQDGAPVPGFNNEAFDKMEKESQESWAVILEYHPDVLARVIRRMKEMFYEVYTDPEVKKANAAIMLQPLTGIAHLFNGDDGEEPIDMEKLRGVMEKAFDAYFEDIYKKENFWEPLVAMSLKMATRVEKPAFRNAIKQWSRGEREGLKYMIDESFEDFLDVAVWVAQGSLKSADKFFISVIESLERKVNEGKMEFIRRIVSSTGNMFNKEAFRPMLKIVANMMKDPEEHKKNPDKLVSDVVDVIPDMMAGMDPEIAAQMKDPAIKEMMNQSMNHAFQHPMDPQFHPQAMD